MTEATITARLMKLNLTPVGVWEVKLAKKSKPMPFNSFADHQIDYLLQARRGKLNWKIRDEGVSKKPFDGFTVYKSPAWCICVFEWSGVYLIDIEVFYKEMRTSDRKSLTPIRAQELSTATLLTF